MLAHVKNDGKGELSVHVASVYMSCREHGMLHQFLCCVYVCTFRIYSVALPCSVTFWWWSCACNCSMFCMCTCSGTPHNIMHSSTISNKVTLLWCCHGNSLCPLLLLSGSVATEVQVSISQVLTQVHSTNLETSGYKSVKLNVSHGAGSWEEFS